MTQSLELSQFDYDLPTSLIAQEPAADRHASRLLHLDAAGHLHDRHFIQLPDLLKPHDMLVFNNTQVINARLNGHKASGGKVEVLIERVLDNHQALAHLRSSRAPRPGTRLQLANAAIEVEVLARQEALFLLQFNSPILPLLQQHGSTPLPPYISRSADLRDARRYQTVYARQPGAVAAPTAGLHFDDAMLAQLDGLGLRLAFITLHVGAGTFQPVRVQQIDEHVMHAERYVISQETLELIHTTRSQGGRIIAIGTTSARALESAAHVLEQRQLQGLPAHTAIDTDTRLFITPGYSFRWVDAMLTNFHLPQSTLLMMVSALAGMAPIRDAYAHAVAERYRFFSYGDAMFIESPSRS